MKANGIHPIPKWLMPLGLGLLLILFFLLVGSASTTLAIWGFLFYLAGMAIYLWLFPRPGMIPLLVFHFLGGCVLLFGFESPSRPEGASLALFAFAFISAAILNFGPLISETLLEARFTSPRFALPYLFSLFLGILFIYLFHRDPPLWHRLLLALLVYFFLAYLFWIVSLIRIMKNSKILMDQLGASYLLKGQIFAFLIPLTCCLAILLWKGSSSLPSLIPVVLFFPLSLFLGIYPVKRRQMEVYIVQSEKRKGFGNLLAGLTHEINNPLNFIYSNMEPMQEMVEKLERHLPKSDTEGQKIINDLKKMGGSLEEGVQTIRALIDQFRSFPKPRPEEKEKVDLNQILDRSIELLGHKWKNRIDLQRSFGEIPQVRGFAAELQQVFTNLLANACDATPLGGVVEVTTQNAVGGVNVFVRDSGSGIKRENISKIFDPFFTTKGQGEGTGLGLAIAQQIIKSHGGTIEVQSQEGQGAQFLVFLPA